MLYEIVEKKSAYSSTPDEIIEERIKVELPVISQGNFLKHILVNIFKHKPEERYSAKETLEVMKKLFFFHLNSIFKYIKLTTTKILFSNY